MPNRAVTGYVSSHELPFSIQRHYVWTVTLFAHDLMGCRKTLAETRMYSEIASPFVYGLYAGGAVNDPSIAGYVIRSEVLDDQVVVADAERSFFFDWNEDRKVQNLTLMPQAV